MRYYSEATVNGIIHDMCQGNHIPKATDYPSIEIRTPHGRLIDADKLIHYLENMKPIDSEVVRTCLKCEINDLKNAPTVLEANKED